jgi:predicted DsbA family dithiol-disulfide isomerase
VVTEFLNPFCPHCRATHARLEEVLRATSAPVRRFRVYVWSSDAPPLWAQACACAAASGKEDALFAELLRASRDVPAEVWAAARRAGLDPNALSAAVRAGHASARRQAERQRVNASTIRKLPTIDIGRWRLEGEPSAAELRNAVDLAVAAAAPARSAPATTARQ